MSYIDFNGQSFAIGRASYGGDSSDVSGDLSGVVQIYSTVGAFAALKTDGSVVTWGGIEGLMAYNYWTADTSGNLIYIPEEGGDSRVGMNVLNPDASLDSSGTFYLGEHSQWDYTTVDFSGSDTFGRGSQLTNGGRRNVKKIITGEKFTLVLYDNGTVRFYTTTTIGDLGGLIGISGESDIADIFTQNYTVPISCACIVAIYRNGRAKAWTYSNTESFIGDLSDSTLFFKAFSIGTTLVDASHSIICVGSGSSSSSSIAAEYFRNTYEYTNTVLNLLVANHKQLEIGQNFIAHLGNDGRIILHFVFDLFTNNRFSSVNYQGLRDIVKIACGKDHILALDKNRRAFAFAHNLITDDRITGVGPLSDLSNIYMRSGVLDIYAGGEFSILLLEDGSLYSCGSIDISSGILRNNAKVFAGNDTIFTKKYDVPNRIKGTSHVRDHVQIGSDALTTYIDDHALTVYDSTRNLPGSIYIGGRGKDSYSQLFLGDDLSSNAYTQSTWFMEHKRGNTAEDHHFRLGFRDGGADKDVIVSDTCGNIRMGYVSDISSYRHRLAVNGSQLIDGDLEIAGSTSFGSGFRFSNNVLYVQGTQVGIMTSTPTAGTTLDIVGNQRLTGNLVVVGDADLRGQTSFSSGFTINTFYSVSATGVAIGKLINNARLDVQGDAIISTDLRASNAYFTVDTTTPRIALGRSNPRYPLDVSGRAAITGNTEFGGIVSIGKVITSSTALDVSGSSVVSGNMTVGRTTESAIVGIDVSGSGLITGQVGIGKPSIASNVFLDVSGTSILNGNVGIRKTPVVSLDVSGNTAISGTIAVSGTSSFLQSTAIGKTTASATLDVSGNTIISGSSAVGKTTISASHAMDISGDTRITGTLFVTDLSSSRTLSQWTTTGNNIFYQTGRVAIGRTDPSTTLDVSGTTFVSGNTTICGTLFVRDISGFTGSQWVTSGNNISFTGGNVGIGRNATSNALDVSGTVAATTLTGIVSTSSQPNITSVGTLSSLNVSGNVGVGRTSTLNTLDVSGTTFVSGNTTICGTLFVRDISGFTGSQWTTSGSNLFYQTGSVGIGTSSPSSVLDVSGTSRITGNTTICGTLFVRDISGFMGSQWTTSGNNIFYQTGNVGIGTASPSAMLDVSGSARVIGNTTICGTLFVNNISGFSGSQWTTSGSTISYTTGNVGIGKTSPTTALDIRGGITLSNTSAYNTNGFNRNRLNTVIVETRPYTHTWTSQTSAADNIWRSITWSPELSLFVVTGDSGTGNRVMTSPNGTTWTTRSTSGIDSNYYGVAWSPQLSLFAIVGTGNVLTSPNGITWTSRSLPGSFAFFYWMSVCWSPELSLFAAVAQTSNNGTSVMTSSDGITWTGRNTSGFDNMWQSVCWGANANGTGLFVAVANSGTGNRVMTSPDGITWTTRSTSGFDNMWQSVCWSPELSLFVAVSTSGTGNRVMTSTTGLTWTTRTSAADSMWQSVCWSPELGIFVAVASSTGVASNAVMTSTNGTTWTLRTAASTNNWASIVWSPQLLQFTAVANSGTGNRVMTSSYSVYSALNVDNYLFSSPSGLSYGLCPAMQYYRLTSAYTGSNVNTAQSVFGVGVTLAANTQYEFDAFYYLGRASGTTSHTVSLLFGGTATINNIAYFIQHSQTQNDYAGAYTISTNYFIKTTSQVVSSSINTAAYLLERISGTVSINASGTFIPQYQLSAAPGAYTTNIGSYFKIWPIGPSVSNVSIGSWA